jgi:hypothetical protein
MATNGYLRNQPLGVQPEVCDLCGRLVPNDQLIVSDVEGLRGYAVCPYCEGDRRLLPSWQDLRRHHHVTHPEYPTREEPTGAGLWWKDA